MKTSGNGSTNALSRICMKISFDERRKKGGGAYLKACDLHLHSKPCHVLMKILTIFKEERDGKQ